MQMQQVFLFAQIVAEVELHEPPVDEPAPARHVPRRVFFGDDALAMSLSALLHVDIRWVYLASDLCVLALSLTYIPLKRIAFSLLTVVLSGQIIGWIQPKKRTPSS